MTVLHTLLDFANDVTLHVTNAAIHLPFKPDIPDPDPAQPPGTGGISTILGWLKWIGYSVVGAAVVIGGIMISVSFRRGEGHDALPKIDHLADGRRDCHRRRDRVGQPDRRRLRRRIMAKDDDEQSPWQRPGFIAAAVLVVVVFLLGVGLTIFNLTRSDDQAGTEQTPSASGGVESSAATDATSGANSVCGLPGYQSTGRLVVAPEATWEYQGTVAYPTSKTYGPQKTSGDSVRYCFQHTAAGALFMAANGLVQATTADTAIVKAWAEYALSDGPYRATLMEGLNSERTAASDLRMAIAGYRLLAFDGSTARVDLGVTATSQGQTVTGSMVYELIWEDGDWKLNANVAEPFNYSTLPDLAGYISWQA